LAKRYTPRREGCNSNDSGSQSIHLTTSSSHPIYQASGQWFHGGIWRTIQLFGGGERVTDHQLAVFSLLFSTALSFGSAALSAAGWNGRRVIGVLFGATAVCAVLTLAYAVTGTLIPALIQPWGIPIALLGLAVGSVAAMLQNREPRDSGRVYLVSWAQGITLVYIGSMLIGIIIDPKICDRFWPPGDPLFFGSMAGAFVSIAARMYHTLARRDAPPGARAT
jgi:hypothetical protein